MVASDAILQRWLQGGNPDVREAAPNRRSRGRDEPLPDKVDVLIAGTGPAGLCWPRAVVAVPEIETMIVERMSGNIIKGKADGINTRTMEMFQAFGFADKVKRETYWVNQTAFWMPDPENPEHIKRVGSRAGCGRRQLGDAAHPDQPGAAARAVPGGDANSPSRWSPTTAGRSWA